MKKNKNTGLKATTTRSILSLLMFIVIIGSAAGFYFGLKTVTAYAIEVSHSVSDANASGNNVEQLGTLKQALTDREALVAKANTLFATPATYQSQVLKDLQKYASETGVTISGTEFDKLLDGSAAPAMINSHSVIVTIGSPVSYAHLLKFLDAVEGNLPKLQVTGISLNHLTAASGDMVGIDKIAITVATK